MSLMSKNEIVQALNDKEILFEPLNSEYIGPDSIDICLGPKLLIAKKTGKIVDIKNGAEMEFDEHDLSKAPYDITPGEFILASTFEKFGVSNCIVGTLEGRSSMARIGIVIHQTAGLIHAGWGFQNPCRLTLEISSVNPNPVRIYDGMKIGQVSFMRLKENVDEGYDEMCNTKYKNQEGPLPTKINEDFKK
jgi:dCTP deaminase